MSYRPPFSDPAVVATARSRGLIADPESLPDGLRRVAVTLAAVDAAIEPGRRDLGPELEEALLAGRIAVSSQLLAGAGRTNEVAACTVLPVAGRCDATRLERLVAEAAAASQMGLGCGMDLSDFDDPAAALLAVNERMRRVHTRLRVERRRPPALMVSCSSQHPRILEFVHAKRGADLSTWVANISVRIESDADWARLRHDIATAAHTNGEPGVLFQDIADADNPTPGIELTSTAPCAEVFLAPGERCVFLSVNLAAHVASSGFDWTAYDRSIRLAVRSGDAAVELAAVGADPIVAQRRRIGIGVVGFHTALILLGVPYASGAGLADRLSERLVLVAHGASADLAARRGPFPLFEGSRWTDATWRRRKPHRSRDVDAAAWDAVDATIEASGVRNAAIVAYPPTGVVAELLGVSRSYEPHFSLVGRTGVASTVEVGIVPEVDRALAGSVDASDLRAQALDPATGFQLADAGSEHLLACARQLDPETHLAIHAAFSGLADEAGSKTINLASTATVEDTLAVMDRARHLNLKGTTVFRDGCLSSATEGAS